MEREFNIKFEGKLSRLAGKIESLVPKLYRYDNIEIETFEGGHKILLYSTERRVKPVVLSIEGLDVNPFLIQDILNRTSNYRQRYNYNRTTGETDLVPIKYRKRGSLSYTFFSK